MKTLVTLVLLALICFLRHCSAAPDAPSSLSQECCPDSSQVHVRKGKVKHVEIQHNCRHKAIVITTVCDRKICIDRNWSWGKKLLRDFKSASTNKKSPSAQFNVLPCV